MTFSQISLILYQLYFYVFISLIYVVVNADNCKSIIIEGENYILLR